MQNSNLTLEELENMDVIKYAMLRDCIIEFNTDVHKASINGGG